MFTRRIRSRFAARFIVLRGYAKQLLFVRVNLFSVFVSRRLEFIDLNKFGTCFALHSLRLVEFLFRSLTPGRNHALLSRYWMRVAPFHFETSVAHVTNIAAVVAPFYAAVALALSRTTHSSQRAHDSATGNCAPIATQENTFRRLNAPS
jgi:hypothetical protein